MTVHCEEVRQDLVVNKPQRRRVTSRGARVGTRTTVNAEVKAWLKDGKIKHHWYFYERDFKLFIAFHDKQDALMFKLTWH